MTIKETAEILRVSPVTVRRHIAAGRLRALRVGGRVRIDRGELAKLVKPVSVRRRRPMASKPKLFTKDDPLWRIVGIGRSDGPTDVSSDKHKYLVEAYESEFK